MLTLSLLRHAKSSWNNPALADRDRPLATRGVDRRAAHGPRHGRARHRSRPRAVLLGAAHARHARPRAARAQGRAARSSTRMRSITPSAAEMLEMLRDVQPGATRRLMLVGHNPEIQAFALDLVGSGPKHYRDQLEEKYPTAGLAVVNFTSGSWKGVTVNSGSLKPVHLRRKACAVALEHSGWNP